MIEKIILKDYEFEEVEVDGEIDFKEVVKNKRTLPCKLTNYALKKGKEEGLLKESVVQSLVKLSATTNNKKKGKEEEEREFLELLGSIDESDIQTTIYLGLIGAKPNIELSFDEFIKSYHYGLTESLTIYMRLITQHLQSKEGNNFAKGLVAATAKAEKKK